MTATLASPTLNRLLAELQSAGDAWEQFVLSQCDEMQRTHQILADRQNEWTAMSQMADGDRRHVADERAALRARELELEQETQRLSAALARLSDEESQFQAEQVRLAEQQANFAAEHARAMEGLNRAQAELEAARAEEHDAKRAEARDKLASLEADLARVTAELQHARGAGSEERLAEIRAENQELLNRLSALERERVTWLAERRSARAQATAVADQAAKVAAAQEQLIQLRAELARERSAWTAEHAAAERELSAQVEEYAREIEQLRDECQRVKAQAARGDQAVVALAAARHELAQLRAQLAELQAIEQSTLESHGRPLPEALAEIERERDALRAELQKAREEATDLAEAAQAAATLHAELAALRSQAAAAAPSESVDTDASHHTDASHQHGESHHEDGRVVELERELNVLEDELETVRNRAADLTEALTSERRSMADQRAQWSGELSTLRKTLEVQASLVEERPAREAASASPRARQPVAAGAADSGAHAVLDSVMAQFEYLQRERQRRRPGGATN